MRHPTTLYAMPKCAGGELDAMAGLGPCQLNPAAFIVGTDVVDQVPTLVYAAACPFHQEEIRSYLSIPHGALVVEYTANAWQGIVQELEQGTAWELRWTAG